MPQGEQGTPAAQVAPPQAPPANAEGVSPPAPSVSPQAPVTPQAPEIAGYMRESEERWQTERQQLAGQVEQLKQYEQLVLQLARDPQGADVIMRHMDPNYRGQPQPPQPPTQPQPVQNPNAPYQAPSHMPGVDPDVASIVQQTVGQAVGHLRDEFNQSMQPYLRDLRDLQVTTDIARLRERYPDIVQADVQQAIKNEMQATPGISLEKAYRLVTVDRALDRARTQGMNEGMQNARLGVVMQPTQAQGGLDAGDQVQKQVTDLMRSSNTQEAARIAFAEAIRKHSAPGGMF